MSNETSASTLIANALGYLIGLGSLMLYTPIAIRLYRQKTAHGTTLSTWMMKLASYTCNDLYSLSNRYPLSTYIDTLIITVEAAVVLAMVVHYQHRLRDPAIWIFVITYGTIFALLYVLAPPKLLALGQLLAAALNSGALVPQFLWNRKQRSKGDYSPITALLAVTGCAVRLWTVQELANNDVVLLGSYGIALVLNLTLFLQILYYGTLVEGLSVAQVLAADVVHTPSVVAAVYPLEEDMGDGGHYTGLIRIATPYNHQLVEEQDDNDVRISEDPPSTPAPSRFAVPDRTSTSIVSEPAITDYEMSTRWRSPTRSHPYQHIS